ncbi:MAG: hypothetical protein E6Q60_10795 [Nitrosomonas oligotropha]|uniref:YD repeat-containing protein n=1 Tax=Nitrosomonas oligotropha TaxID=42354 RepID=A0A5C7VPU1_9PROT|nr:MAG: hypothetical protein E6Q60_10795 [Nitrosomonas oligotropha]
MRFATYTYDTQGRMVVTEHAGEVERYVSGYSTDGSHTHVTDPLGSQYTHNFQTILGAMGNRTKEERFDSGNNLAKTQQREYDALNRL